MFYFLRQNLFEHREFIEIAGHTDVTGQLMWTAGIRFATPLPKQTLLLDPAYGTRFPDYFDTTVPVMSGRLLAALKGAGIDSIDEYPVTLKRIDTGQEYEGYTAVNLIGCVDAVDLTQSKFRLRFGKPYFTGAVAIDSDKAKGFDAFRLLKGPGFMVLSERVAERVRSENLEAVMLQPTTDYKGT
jgi:hypothetical protein